MHKVTCTLSILVLHLTVLSQQLLIVYEFNQLSLPLEIASYAPDIEKQKLIARYSLYINHGISVYTRDSIYLDHETPRKGFTPYYFKNIYKDYNNDLWIENSGALKKGYCLSMRISDLKKKYEYFDWEITKETKTIIGMECFKAISKNGEVAWFTKGIPYPDGPEDVIFNLPGLVLSYETAHHQWKAVETSFDKREIVFPGCTMEKNEDKIKLTVFELKNLSKEDYIRIDKNTPLKKWVKFEN